MVALNPGFPFRILSHSFGKKLDKIRNRKPGFKAIPMVPHCVCIPTLAVVLQSGSTAQGPGSNVQATTVDDPQSQS